MPAPSYPLRHTFGRRAGRVVGYAVGHAVGPTVSCAVMGAVRRTSGSAIGCAVLRAVALPTLVPLFLAGSVPGSASATVRTVALDGSADYTSIQQAILDSSDGDEIVVAPGTYRERIRYGGRRLVVRSTEGPTVTTIDADSTGSAVTMDLGEGRETILQGFTLRGGIGSRLRDGEAETTSPEGPVARLREQSEKEGVRNRFGGGVLLLSTAPTLRDLVIVRNGAGYGGGLYGLGASPRMEDCRFVGNVAGTGAAACFEFEGAPEFDRCRFSSNFGATGGGVALTLASGRLEDCTFEKNLSGEGGALRIYGATEEIAIDGCVFWKNRSGEGSAILADDGRLRIEGCTFYGNGFPETDPADLLFRSGSSVTLERSILARTAAAGPLLCLDSSVQRRCLDIHPDPGSLEGCPPGPDEFSADPLFCNAEAGDLHLRAGSPCLPGSSPPRCGLIGALGESDCPPPAGEVRPR